MFCTKCRAQILEGASFCTSCGAPVLGASQPTAAPAGMGDYLKKNYLRFIFIFFGLWIGFMFFGIVFHNGLLGLLGGCSLVALIYHGMLNRRKIKK